MRKNNLLYNAAIALTDCAKFIRPVDENFAKIMLDKAQEFADQIKVDDKLEQEVNEFEERIRKGIKDNSK